MAGSHNTEAALLLVERKACIEGGYNINYDRTRADKSFANWVEVQQAITHPLFTQTGHRADTIAHAASPPVILLHAIFKTIHRV
jgi:hypothetical protein